MKDVRIGIIDGSFVHLTEAVITYQPSAAEPKSIQVAGIHFFVEIPYNRVEYIVENWSKTSA